MAAVCRPDAATFSELRPSHTPACHWAAHTNSVPAIARLLPGQKRLGTDLRENRSEVQKEPGELRVEIDSGHIPSTSCYDCRCDCYRCCSRLSPGAAN